MTKQCRRCEIIFDEDYSVEGDADLCEECRKEDNKRQQRNAKARQRRHELKEVYDSLGMKRVRGSLGGVYYE